MRNEKIQNKRKPLVTSIVLSLIILLLIAMGIYLWHIRYEFKKTDVEIALCKPGNLWSMYEPNSWNDSVFHQVEDYCHFDEDSVTYANTRAAAATLNVTSPKTYGRYTEDKDVFGIMAARSTDVHMGAGNSAVNYLQAGLKIEKPQYLEPYPTSGSINGGYSLDGVTLDGTYPAGWYDVYKNDAGQHKDTDNTIALQLNNIENGSVTSDYALLIPSLVRLEGLIWQKSKHAESPMYKEPGFGPAAGGVTGDEKGWYSTEDKIFIWDSPKEALDNGIGAALELPVYDSYIDLKEYIGIRILKENVIKRNVAKVNWNACEFTATVADPEGVKKYFGQEESSRFRRQMLLHSVALLLLTVSLWYVSWLRTMPVTCCWMVISSSTLPTPRIT